MAETRFRREWKMQWVNRFTQSLANHNQTYNKKKLKIRHKPNLKIKLQPKMRMAKTRSRLMVPEECLDSSTIKSLITSTSAGMTETWKTRSHAPCMSSSRHSLRSSGSTLSPSHAFTSRLQSHSSSLIQRLRSMLLTPSLSTLCQMRVPMLRPLTSWCTPLSWQLTWVETLPA